MIAAEILKITSKRGLWLSAVLFPLAMVILVGVLALATGGEDIDSGDDFMEVESVVAGLVAIIMVVIVGAQVGAWDFQHGTFRYLTLTGRRPIEVYGAKTAAMMVLVVLMVLPAIAAAIVFAAVVPTEGDVGLTLEGWTGGSWRMLLATWVFGLISFSVGALLRSNGPAIGMALFLDLGGLEIIRVLTLIHDDLDRVALSNAISVASGDQDGGPMMVAVLVIAGWLAGFVGSGAVRTARGEY